MNCRGNTADEISYYNAMEGGNATRDELDGFGMFPTATPVVERC